MDSIAPLINGWGFITLLVFARFFGVALMLPAIGGRAASLMARAVLCGCLTILIAPACADWVPTQFNSASPSTAILLAAKELAMGLILGVGIQILLLGVQVAGQLVSQIGGVSLAAVYDASSGNRIGPVSRLLDFLAMSVFLLLGGHRVVLSALLNTFQDWPPGTVEIGMTAADAAAQLLTESFLLGIQAALPIMATLFVSNILAGMLGRLMPQMNVLLVSTGMNSLLLMASMFVGLGAMAWTLQEHLEPLVGTMVRLCGGS